MELGIWIFILLGRWPVFHHIISIMLQGFAYFCSNSLVSDNNFSIYKWKYSSAELGFVRHICTNATVPSVISHSAPFCNRNVHSRAHFCYKVVGCGIFICGNFEMGHKCGRCGSSLAYGIFFLPIQVGVSNCQNNCAFIMNEIHRIHPDENFIKVKRIAMKNLSKDSYFLL